MTRAAEILRIEVGQVGLWSVLHLEGELDIAGLPAFQQGVERVCTEGDPPRLIVDFSAVTFIDSCGLSGVVRAWKRVSGLGGRFVLVGVRGRVLQVFRITGTLQAFEIYDDLNALVAVD